MANDNITVTDNQAAEKVQESLKVAKSKARTPNKQAKAK